MIPDSENPLDGDRYDWPPLVPGDRAATLNGVAVLRDLRPWPVRFEEQMQAIEERLQRLETATGGDGASLLRWYDSVMKNPPFAEDARDGEGVALGALRGADAGAGGAGTAVGGGAAARPAHCDAVLAGWRPVGDDEGDGDAH